MERINEEIELVKVDKGVYNAELRHKRMVPYIYISTSGQIRFSSALVAEFNIKGGEKFDCFSNTNGNRVFFRIDKDGNFTIAKHDRRLKANDTKKGVEYIAQSSGFRNVLNGAFPSFKGKPVKLFIKAYIENIDCYELEPIGVISRKKKK